MPMSIAETPTVLYRVVWVNDDRTIVCTRPIGLTLAYEALGQLLADGRMAKVQRRRADGRWSSIGAPTPAVSRKVAITRDDIR